MIFPNFSFKSFTKNGIIRVDCDRYFYKLRLRFMCGVSVIIEIRTLDDVAWMINERT